MSKLLISSLCFIFVFFSLYTVQAQDNVIKGKVWDDVRKEPLMDVTVHVKGTQRSVITDVNGNFSIAAKVGETLQFSFIGYTTVEKVVTNRTNLQIYLSETAEEFDQIVVVGYGVQKKVSAIGSIAQTKGDVLIRTGSGTSITQALQGIMPGVISINTTSKPGADAADLLIRGKSSWVSDGNKPLFLVDGVERDFNDIDANEIETLSVLKDASATAVYGVKGANGVILVTTKRGALKKPVINFSANFGLKQPTSKPEYADYITTMNLFNEAARNDKQWGDLIPESTVAAWEAAFATGNYGPYNTYFPEIDWWDEMTKTGSEQNYNINIGGGTEYMKYFASLSYFYDGDIFKTHKANFYDPSFFYRRYNWRSNFDFNVTKNTTFSVNLAGKQGHRNQTGYRLGDGNSEDGYGQSIFFETIYSAARHTFPITWEDGIYGVQSNGLGNLLNNFDKGQRTNKYYQNFVDLSLKQNLDIITKGLSANIKFSYNAESNTTSRIQKYKGSIFAEGSYIAWYRDFDYSQPLPEGGYVLNSEKRWANETFQGNSQEASYDNIMVGGYHKRLYYEFALNYTRSFGNHNVSALALINRNEVEGLVNSSATQLRFPDKDEAWVARLTYNWKERYMVEFNGSYTGSQKFARGKRFAFFPSYSVGWRLSEEPFIKKHIGDFLTNMKVRYSYGIVGYDKSAATFTYLQIYNNVGGNGGLGDNGFIRLGTDPASLTTYGPLFREGQTANENATWETAYKQNLGFEIVFFNHLNTTIDLYKEDRKGILMKVDIPAYSGTLPADGNIGRTKSHGFEFEIGWNDRIGKDFNYWLKGSYAFNENRIVYRNDPVYTPNYQKQAGKPIDYRTKLLAIGYYSSLDDIFNYSTANNYATQQLLVPGDLMYVDYNADGLIDDTGDVVPVKYNNYPQQTFSWSIGTGYKGFEVSALFYGVENVYKDLANALQWDFQEASIRNYYAGPNVVSRWTAQTAETAEKPALHYLSAARGYSMRAGTTYAFKNASYIRLKTVEVSYLFRLQFIRDFGISKLQIYANGNNLLTFTGFDKRADPEVNNASLYPLVKRYNFGIRLAF
jgi:TonB-linked SusC/RagA family outer membrane protein